MKWLAGILGLALVANAATAQVNYNIIKRQAHDAENASANASQGVAPQAPPAAPPVNPVLAATLQNISSLAGDIDALCKAPAGTPDPALKLPLLNDLAAAAQGAKPAQEAIQKLAADFSAAVTGHKIAHEQQTKVAQILHAVMNSSHLAAAQQQSLPGIVQKVLEHAGVATDDATNIAADLKALVDQTK